VLKLNDFYKVYIKQWFMVFLSGWSKSSYKQLIRLSLALFDVDNAQKLGISRQG